MITKKSLRRIWLKIRLGNIDFLDIVGRKVYKDFISLHEENEGFRDFLEFCNKNKISWGILSNIDKRMYLELKKGLIGIQNMK